MTSAPLADELRHYLIEAAFAHAAPERRKSHWVMTAEWLNECRKLTDSTGFPLYYPVRVPGQPETMFGLPIEVREGGGAPHLEQEPG